MSEASERLLSTLAARIASLGRHLTPESIDPDAGLLDAGYVDSMAVADLLVAIEVEYGVVIDGDRLLDDLHTLRALAEWIAEQQRSVS